MINTRFSDLFGLSYPIVSAPMGLMSGGQLAAAVSNAGGLGTFGATTASLPVEPEYVEEQIRQIRSHTERPFGIGFITQLIERNQRNFDIALDRQVPVILLSFADPRPWLEKIKAHGATAICQVQSIDDAHIALAEGADILAVQGSEAGGHTGKLNLLPFLAQVLDAFPDTPIIAAGGMASARSLAAILSAGADGAWIGTAFTAVTEAQEITDEVKQRILASDGNNTIQSHVFDILNTHAYQALPWRPDIAPRTSLNLLLQTWHGNEEKMLEQIKQVAEQFVKGRESGDPDVAPDWYGESAGFVNEIQTASAFMQELCSEAERHIEHNIKRISGRR